MLFKWETSGHNSYYLRMEVAGQSLNIAHLKNIGGMWACTFGYADAYFDLGTSVLRQAVEFTQDQIWAKLELSNKEVITRSY